MLAVLADASTLTVPTTALYWAVGMWLTVTGSVWGLAILISRWQTTLKHEIASRVECRKQCDAALVSQVGRLSERIVEVDEAEARHTDRQDTEIRAVSERVTYLERGARQ